VLFWSFSSALLHESDISRLDSKVFFKEPDLASPPRIHHGKIA